MNSRSARLAVLLLALPILAFLSYQALVRGLADKHGEAGRLMMASWQTSVPKQSWLEAREEITLAIKYDPADGAHYYRRARLYHLCVVYLVDCDLSKIEAVSIAENNYITAREKRPMWVQAIAHHAMLKRDIGLLDDEFHELVNAAVTLGPRIPAGLRLISRIALSRWSSFDLNEQEMLADHVIRGLESPTRGVRPAVLDLLKSHKASVDGVMVDRLYGYLKRDIESTEWDTNFVELTFMFWSGWSLDERLALINRLNLLATTKRVRHVLKIAKDHRKLPIACAVLVQSKAVTNACTNKKLRLF